MATPPDITQMIENFRKGKQPTIQEAGEGFMSPPTIPQSQGGPLVPTNMDQATANVAGFLGMGPQQPSFSPTLSDVATAGEQRPNLSDMSRSQQEDIMRMPLRQAANQIAPEIRTIGGNAPTPFPKELAGQPESPAMPTLAPEATFTMPDGSVREILPTDTVASKFPENDNRQQELISTPIQFGQPTIQGPRGTGFQRAPEGMVKAIGPDGNMIFATPEQAAKLNAAEGQARIADQKAMVDFQQSPEGRATTQRMIESAIRGGEFGAASAEREARLAQRDLRPGETQTERDTRIAASRTQGAQRDGLSMAEATRLTGGDRDAARALIEQERQGINPLTGQTFESEAFKRMENMQSLSGGADLSEREKRQQRLQDILGVSPAQAVRIDQNVDKIITNPDTGQTVIYDPINKTTTPIDMAPEISEQMTANAPEASPQRASQSLAEMAKQSTGIVPSLKILAQRVAGQPGMKFYDAPEMAQMRQNIEIAKRQLIRALSVNDRYPVSEQKAIEKEINITPSALNDPVTMEAQIKAVDEALRQRLEDEENASTNMSLSSSTRQAALQAANDIKNFLDLLGVDREEDKEVKDTSGFDEKTRALIDKWAPEG